MDQRHAVDPGQRECDDGSEDRVTGWQRKSAGQGQQRSGCCSLRCGQATDDGEEIAEVLAPMGLRLSDAKTRIVHLSDGFAFLGFRIQRRLKRGTTKSYVYTFIDQRPIRSVKAKIRAFTHRLSQQDLTTVLTRLNQVMHGWANYFRYAVAKNVFSMLENFAWRRVFRMLTVRHHWNRRAVRRRFIDPAGRWLPITADGIELGSIATIPVTRYRYRGTKIPNPWVLQPH